jgi:hypothetical protein
VSSCPGEFVLLEVPLEVVSLATVSPYIATLLWHTKLSTSSCGHVPEILFQLHGDMGGGACQQSTFFPTIFEVELLYAMCLMTVF